MEFKIKTIPKRTKGSKDKADSHRTTQPKAYGIMAGKYGGFAELLCFLPPCGTYSVSFWSFRLSALLEWLSFSVFVLENNFKRELRTTPGTAPQSKQRFVLIVVDFANQFAELLKVVFDNVVEIRINRQLVNAHNVSKPVKPIVVFLPNIDRFSFACRCGWDFEKLSAVILFGQLLWLGGRFWVFLTMCFGCSASVSAGSFPAITCIRASSSTSGLAKSTRCVTACCSVKGCFFSSVRKFSIEKSSFRVADFCFLRVSYLLFLILYPISYLVS